MSQLVCRVGRPNEKHLCSTLRDRGRIYQDWWKTLMLSNPEACSLDDCREILHILCTMEFANRLADIECMHGTRTHTRARTQVSRKCICPSWACTQKRSAIWNRWSSQEMPGDNRLLVLGFPYPVPRAMAGDYHTYCIVTFLSAICTCCTLQRMVKIAVVYLCMMSTQLENVYELGSEYQWAGSMSETLHIRPFMLYWGNEAVGCLLSIFDVKPCIGVSLNSEHVLAVRTNLLACIVAAHLQSDVFWLESIQVQIGIAEILDKAHQYQNPGCCSPEVPKA